MTSAISRADVTEKILKNGRVCGRHFVSGKAAASWDKYNVDWVPTLKLGHNKNSQQKNFEQASERDRRAKEKERERKETEGATRERESTGRGSRSEENEVE